MKLRFLFAASILLKSIFSVIPIKYDFFVTHAAYGRYLNHYLINFVANETIKKYFFSSPA